MEALKKRFKLKAEFVRSAEEKDSAPSDEQLACFLGNLTKATGLALRGAPPAVRVALVRVVPVRTAVTVAFLRFDSSYCCI